MGGVHVTGYLSYVSCASLKCVRDLSLEFLETQGASCLWSYVVRLGPKAALLHSSHPVPGTVVIPEDGLARPYQGAALLSSIKGSAFLRGD